MFEFEELEASLPPDAYIVRGAGTTEVTGLYVVVTVNGDRVQANGADIFRQQSICGDHLLARERDGERYGWLLGAGRRPLYGARAETLDCPLKGWRSFGASKPVPSFEPFSSTAAAAERLAEIWIAEANALVSSVSSSEEPGDIVDEDVSVESRPVCDSSQTSRCLRHAADICRRAASLPYLSDRHRAKIHCHRAVAFRRLASSEALAACHSTDLPNTERGPLHGLAAEWAVAAAEEAMRLDASCLTAGKEGALAAQACRWWTKGRELAKRTLDAVPAGPEFRAQREEIGALFMEISEKEQNEKALKLQQAQRQQEKEKKERLSNVNMVEVDWAVRLATELKDALKADDFRRPHHQLWKLVSPGLGEKTIDELFTEMRQLVWSKWAPIAWDRGYRVTEDRARSDICARIEEAANTDAEPKLRKVMQEIEERSCIEWCDLPDRADRWQSDDTWTWTRKNDGSWRAQYRQ